MVVGGSSRDDGVGGCAHTDQVGDEEEDVLVRLVCWRGLSALGGLLESAIALVDPGVGGHCGAWSCSDCAGALECDAQIIVRPASARCACFEASVALSPEVAR